MKRNKATFLMVELVLFLLTAFCVFKIFSNGDEQKRIAVIMENSGDDGWDSLISGMKQAAEEEDVHLIICNTGEIENAEEEKELIMEQLDNDVSGFLIYPAPGSDTVEMLTDVRNDVPLLLFAEDVYGENSGTNSQTGSSLTGVFADQYGMGYALGKEVLSDVTEGSVGIVYGNSKSQGEAAKLQGFTDAISGTSLDIKWILSKDLVEDVSDEVERYAAADVLVVLDQTSLVEVAGAKESSALYGIGNSLKAASYVDSGEVTCLVMADDYAVGYDSVKEMARNVNRFLYTMQSKTETYQVLRKSTIYTEDIQNFLYTYR